MLWVSIAKVIDLVISKAKKILFDNSMPVMHIIDKSGADEQFIVPIIDKEHLYLINDLADIVIFDKSDNVLKYRSLKDNLWKEVEMKESWLYRPTRYPTIFLKRMFYFDGKIRTEEEKVKRMESLTFPDNSI